MKHQKLLTDEYPLIVLPELACKLGTNSAIALQQIHYWAQKKVGRIIDGVRWIYNTYQQWQEQLPFLSISTIKRAFTKLRSLNLIVVERHDKSEWNHRNYYRIDYERLKALQLSIGSSCTEQLTQDEPSSSAKLESSSMSTETTAKTTSDTKAVKEKSFPQNQIAEELIEKYEDKLKTYGIYRQSWSNEVLVPNPKLKPILATLGKVSRDRAERSILAFLAWIKDAKNVEDKYKAFRSAIARNWEAR